ncbi:MAG: hypothetical protein LBL62_08830 [Planctomycetaceae bacterium]|nr:hypothetical protein [Planctomycetaceae bacterium]
MGDLSLKGRVGVLADSELNKRRQIVLPSVLESIKDSTGATLQRRDRPPDDCLLLMKIPLKYYQLFYYSGRIAILCIACTMILD